MGWLVAGRCVRFQYTLENSTFLFSTTIFYTKPSIIQCIGHLPSTSLACKAATAVAQLWELRPESAEALITTRRPKLEHTNRLEKSLVVIGRIALRVFSVAKAKYSSFALTSASLRVMERIAAW